MGPEISNLPNKKQPRQSLPIAQLQIAVQMLHARRWRSLFAETKENNTQPLIFHTLLNALNLLISIVGQSPTPRSALGILAQLLLLARLIHCFQLSNLRLKIIT